MEGRYGQANAWECCQCRAANLRELYKRCPQCDHTKCPSCKYIVIKQRLQSRRRDFVVPRATRSPPPQARSENWALPTSPNNKSLVQRSATEDRAEKSIEKDKRQSPPQQDSSLANHVSPSTGIAPCAPEGPKEKLTPVGLYAGVTNPEAFGPSTAENEAFSSIANFRLSAETPLDSESAWAETTLTVSNRVEANINSEAQKSLQEGTRIHHQPEVGEDASTTKIPTYAGEEASDEDNYLESKARNSTRATFEQSQISRTIRRQSPFWKGRWILGWLEGWSWKRNEPPLQPGMVRIRFSCACQTSFWDDYPEIMADAAMALKQELAAYFSQMTPASRNTQSRGFRQIIYPFTAVILSVVMPVRRLFTSNTQSCENRNLELESQGMPGTSHAAETNSFYLTCCSKGSRIPGLTQSPASAINSDLEYFDLLRKIVNDSKWTLKGLLNPRKISSIEYVKFELLFDNEHVEVRQVPGYPENKGHYQPCKADFETENFCPWGPNTLLHFFERRHKCVEHPRILARIPRKLKEKLVVSDDGEFLIGWGMQLVDGVDGPRMGMLGIIGLIMSSLMGVLWAKLHGNDIQGGTGLTQCLMAFVTFLVTMNGVVGFVEQKN